MATVNQKIKKIEASQDDIFHCNLSIKGVPVGTRSILFLQIRENVLELLPKLDLIISDSGFFFERFPLEDNDEIVVEFSKSRDKESPVQKMTFLLQDFSVDNMDRDRIQSVSIRMTAILKTQNIFFPLRNKSFKRSSSFDAIKRILQLSEIEIESKIKPTDLMTWLQINMSDFEMIKHIIEHSFVEDDYVLGYVDRTQVFKLTSLKTELEKDEVIPLIFDPKKSINDLNEDAGTAGEGADDSKPIIYFNNFKYNSMHGSINKTIGYGILFDTYDLNGKEVTNGITSDDHFLTDFSMKDKDAAGNPVRRLNLGLKYPEDNTHDNFLKAKLQNDYIKQTFFFQPISFWINPTDKIRLFDKVNVILPAMLVLEGGSAPEINESYSGEHLIGQIIHQIDKGGQYKQIITCYRNGFDKNSFTEDSEYKSNAEQGSVTKFLGGLGITLPLVSNFLKNKVE